MRRAGILGLGFWAPDTVRGNDAWGPEFVQAFHKHREQRREGDFTDHQVHAAERAYDHLYAKYVTPFENDPFKGATTRRVADPTVPIARGEAEAAARALEDARVHAREIELVLSSSIPQDKLCPSNAPAIAHALGCNGAASLGVETYCASGVAQLDLAAALVESGRARYVLCVQSQLVGRINDLRLPASPLFGDGAGAFVVGEVPEDRGFLHVTRGGNPAFHAGVTLKCVAKPDAVWWQGLPGPVSPGFDDVDAARLLAKELLRLPIETIKANCDGAGVPLDAVDVFAMIQPCPWFQPAVAEGLGISPARVHSTYAKFAHVGASSIVANLLEARRLGDLRDGSLVSLYGHGAGVTKYAALLRWHAGGSSRR
jgi:3-oxoacyl-[acyl-carrier-protein] synthase-3